MHNLLSSCGPSGLPWWESKADFSSLVAKMKNWALLSRLWIVQKLFSYFIRLQRKNVIVSGSRMPIMWFSLVNSAETCGGNSVLEKPQDLLGHVWAFSYCCVSLSGEFEIRDLESVSSVPRLFTFSPKNAGKWTLTREKAGIPKSIKTQSSQVKYLKSINRGVFTEVALTYAY